MPRIAQHHVVMLVSAVLACAIAAPVVSAASATGLVCRSCVESSDIRDSTITSTDIKNATVSGTDLKNSTVTASDVKDNSLTANDLGASSVGASELADGSVGSTDVADGAIGSADVADGAIGAADIEDGAVGAAEVASDAIGAAEVASGAIGTDEIADGAVGASDLATGSVGVAAIATDAVTAPAIAAGAVGTSEITDSSIALGDLGFDPVTETELETEIDGFNASRSAWHDVTMIDFATSTATPMFGLALHNRDGNDDQITVTRDTRLMVSGSISLEGGGATTENAWCAPYLDSDPFPAAGIGAGSTTTIAPGEMDTLAISGSATLSAGTYDVYVGCALFDGSGAVFTTDGYLNVWLAEQ